MVCVVLLYLEEGDCIINIGLEIGLFGSKVLVDYLVIKGVIYVFIKVLVS